jgi:putative ABC transport system permease protein
MTVLGEIIVLGPVDLAISGGLVLLAGAISLALKLGLEKRLAIASVRTVVQLLLVGYVLGWIFQPPHWWAVVPLVAVMIAAASRAAVKRSSRRIRWLSVLAFGALVACGLITTVTVTGLIVRPQPWYRPQYFIPLLGMVLGNGLTGISLCVDQLLMEFDERADEIEMRLALGATRWEAARGAIREAVRRGMIPIINSMSVVGLVSLPGMMTGQIIAGNDPFGAVKYQIMVMFMIAAATSMGCILMALLVYRRVFSHHHQLRRERIVRR